MSDEPTKSNDVPVPARPRRRFTTRRKALGLGAGAALGSALLAVAANLSEIAAWFAPDETRDLVQETRVAVQDTDAKVNELLVLLRNQAAASGLDLNVESETAIRNAIEAIVISGNAQKQKALAYLDEGEVSQAAETMASLAGNQASAAVETASVAAASWREAGALYYSLDVAEAIRSYEEANRLEPGHHETLEMLGYAFSRAGRLDDAARAFGECLELSPPPRADASARIGLAGVARQRADYAAAKEHLALALALAQSHGLLHEQAHALLGLASVAREQGDLELAQSHLQEAMSISSDNPDDSLKAKVLSNLGILAATREQYDEARRLIEQALDIYVDADDLAGQATTIGNLGAIALLVGATDDAEAHLLQSVSIGERLGWRSSIAYDLLNLGGIAQEREDFAAAEAYLERSEKLATEVGLFELLPVIQANRGEVAFAQDDTQTACRRWAEALPALTKMGSAHAATVDEMRVDAQCPPADVP